MGTTSAFFVFLILLGNANAQETPAQVTTTSRAPEESFETPRAVQVVDPKMSNALSPGEALQDVPGVMPQSTNRGAGAVLIRGFIGPENLILVDGLRFNQSTFRTGPNQYLFTLPMFAMDSLEVVRGPNGTLYGNGTIGGVVNARTSLDTRYVGRWIGDIANGSSDLSAFAAHPFGRLTLGGGVAVGQHGRLTAGADDEFLMAGLKPDGTFLAATMERYGWFLGASYDISDSLNLSTRYLGSSVQDGMRIDRIGNGEIRTYDNVDHFAYIRSESKTSVANIDAALVFHHTDEFVARERCRTVTDFARGEPYDKVADLERCAKRNPDEYERRRKNQDIVTTLGTSIVGTRPLGPVDLMLGGDLYADFVSSSRDDARAPDFEFEAADRGNFSDGSTAANIGVFTRGQYTVLQKEKHALNLHGGARFEHVRAFAPDVPGLGDVNYAFSSVAGSAGVSYLHDIDGHVFLTWNQGFRAPNLQETTVLGDTGSTFETPNDELKPERADTFELGGRWSAPWFFIEPVIYTTLLSNRIDREPTTFNGETEIEGKEVVQRVNQDSGYVYGFEARGETVPVLKTKAFFSFNAMDGAVTTDSDPDFDAGPLHDLFATDKNYDTIRRLFPITYTVGVTLDATDRVSGSAFVRGAGAQGRLASGDRSDLRICEESPGLLQADCDGSDPWTTVNMSVRYEVPRATLRASFLNITDARYRRHGSGVPAAGRSLRLEVTLRY